MAAADFKQLGIRHAARSDVGLAATVNGDACYAGPHLLAVADGSAGARKNAHRAGTEAPAYVSRSAATASGIVIDRLRGLDRYIPSGALLAEAERALVEANVDLRNAVGGDMELWGLGTTVTALHFFGSQLALAHLGDSRAYLLRAGILYQITHDHSYVQWMVDEGRISPDQATEHSHRLHLLRALDGGPAVEADLSLRIAEIGDRYLLATDGLTSVVSAEFIHGVLTDAADPDSAVRRLIELAHQNGSPDNMACAMAEVLLVPAQDVRVPPEPQAARNLGSGAPGPPPGPLPVPLTLAQPTERDASASGGRASSGPAWLPRTRRQRERRGSGGADWRADFSLAGYEVFDLIGEGGNARVYRARRTNLGRDVAVKVIDRRLAKDRDLRRFKREVDATVRLSEHPNVVTLYDADRLADGRPYLVMELCPGGALADRLRRDGPMPAAYVREVGIQIADALAAAHEHGVMHRDIKPANLLVTRFGPVALADFGIAALHVPGQEHSFTLAMTPVYAAPEAFTDAAPAPAADIYSLGATLYALLAGRSPHAPDGELSPTALIGHVMRSQERPVPGIEGVPSGFLDVLRIAMAREPGERLRTAAMVREALRGVRV